MGPIFTEVTMQQKNVHNLCSGCILPLEWTDSEAAAGFLKEAVKPT